MNKDFPIYCTTEKSTILGTEHVLFISLSKTFRPQMFENGIDKKLKNIVAIFEYADTWLSVHKLLIEKTVLPSSIPFSEHKSLKPTLSLGAYFIHSMTMPWFGDKLYGHCRYASLKNVIIM